jgi:hypothetical protein
MSHRILDFVARDDDRLPGLDASYRTWLSDPVAFPAGYIEDRSFLVVDRRHGGLFCTLRSVLGPDLDVRRFDRFAEAATKVRTDNERDCVMVVRIDTFPSVAVALERLEQFRAAYPRCTVVMASSRFVRDDFSATRRCVADASVRLPGGRTQLAMALVSAIENNGCVRARN